MLKIGRAPVHALLLVGLLLLTALTQAPAVEAARHATSSPAKAISAAHVTILILDMSGSMGGTDGNDPDGLRCSAANAFIDLSQQNDYVGVIDLASTSPSAGPHGYGVASVIAQPADMGTLSARQRLRDKVKQATNNCAANGTTPTYDALAKTLTMLTDATKNGQIAGSAILLTDGVPVPQPQDQVKAIQNDLLPQFKQHGWPIDVIALGKPGTQDGVDFHSFLKGISNATSGDFYDDGSGEVQGVSPLNIAPFFVMIFARRIGRTPGPTLPVTSLDNGAVTSDFQISDYVDTLDVIVVKERSDAEVTLYAPGHVKITPNLAGTLYAEDPHYVMYAITQPQSGTWELMVQGSGRFLMNSFTQPSIAISLLSPATNTSALPLGVPFTVKAQLDYHGTVVTSGTFTITGTLVYTGDTGGASDYARDFVLSDAGAQGTYEQSASLPTSAPAGTYEVTVQVSQVTRTPIASISRSMRFLLFPAPYLLDGQNHRTLVASVTAVRWNGVIQFLYGLPVIGWFGTHLLNALDDHPAAPSAQVSGQVIRDDQPYCNATIRGTALRQGQPGVANVVITNGTCGRFDVVFPTPENGTYMLNFQTSGSFADTYGDFAPTTAKVQVRIVDATPQQEIRAVSLTLAYLLILLFLVLLIRYIVAPKPFGVLADAKGRGSEEFARARRGPVDKFLYPSRVRSDQVSLDRGLIFRFSRPRGISVRATDRETPFNLDGSPVPTAYDSAAERRLSDNKDTYIVHANTDEDTGGVARRSTLFDRIFRRKSRDKDYNDYDDNDLVSVRVGRRERGNDRRSDRRWSSRYEDDDDGGRRSLRGSRSRWRNDD